MRTNALALRKGKTRKKARLIPVYALLILAVFTVLLPFYIMLTTSFKNITEIYSEFSWLPSFSTEKGYEWFRAYADIFDTSIWNLSGSIVVGIKNTLLYSIPTTLIGVLVSGMSAYAFAKISFKGRDGLFAILLLTMTMPATIVLIPQFSIYAALKWVGTPLPIIVPGLFGTASAVFFLRQYMRSVPNELIEAGTVDGLNKFMAFWKIVLPAAMPAFVAQFILVFIGMYNDYLGPALFLDANRSLWTMQIVLRKVVSDKNAIQSIMANSLIAIVPLVILYLIFQNVIINGISVSAVKG